MSAGGRATDRMRGLHRLSSPDELRMPVRLKRGSKGAGAKVRVRERNNSDHRLRPPNPGQVEDNNEVRPQRQPGCWLGSSHSFKECVTAHRSSGRAWIIIGHKSGAEDVESQLVCDW